MTLMTSIILVEDDTKLSSLIKQYLEQYDFSVHLLHEGSDAVEVILKQQPDIAVLDLMLPGKSGLEIIRELRAEDGMQALPVLMLTARGQMRDREMAEKAGVTRFMTKPFSNAEVLTAVRDLHAQASQG